jgi:RNA polymerase sigma-70 factor (ECF subfamily)
MMIDAILLSAVRRRSEKALEELIDKYNAYVCAVIRNTAGMTTEDIEETSSDVFLALWNNAGNVRKLKPWLGATARNKARNKLREIRDDLPLSDEIPAEEENELENAVIADLEQGAVKEAIDAMNDPDRIIFLRHYYGLQTVAAIAAETGMTEASVKHRLVRGREKLKPRLAKELAMKFSGNE